MCVRCGVHEGEVGGVREGEVCEVCAVCASACAQRGPQGGPVPRASARSRGAGLGPGVRSAGGRRCSHGRRVGCPGKAATCLFLNLQKMCLVSSSL